MLTILLHFTILSLFFDPIRTLEKYLHAVATGKGFIYVWNDFEALACDERNCDAHQCSCIGNIFSPLT